MQGGDDPDNRRDFPGGFPADGFNAFTTRNEKQRSVFEHQKLLGQLRAELEPLRRGNLLNLLATEHQYVYARNTTKSAVIVAFNNGVKAAMVEFSVAETKLPNGANLRDRLGSVPDGQVANERIKFELPARSAAILVVK